MHLWVCRVRFLGRFHIVTGFDDVPLAQSTVQAESQLSHWEAEAWFWNLPRIHRVPSVVCGNEFSLVKPVYQQGLKTLALPSSPSSQLPIKNSNFLWHTHFSCSWKKECFFFFFFLLHLEKWGGRTCFHCTGISFFIVSPLLIKQC